MSEGRTVLFEILDEHRFIGVRACGIVDDEMLDVLESYIARQRQRAETPDPEIVTASTTGE